MQLADRYLPTFQYVERHRLAIRGEARRALDAVASLSSHDDPLIRRLLGLRELPARLASRLGKPNALSGQPKFGLHNFTLLERDADRTVLYGLVGRFWRMDFGLEPISDADAFKRYATPGVAKLLLGFECLPIADGMLELRTETRVFCPDRTSRLLFMPYWLAIRPASGLIRRRLLASINATLPDSA